MALRRGAGLAIAGLGAATAFRYRSVVQRQRQLPNATLSFFDDNHRGSSLFHQSKVPNSKDDSSRQFQPQRVLIIGAGVVGVSTAFKLAQRGHKVVILVRFYPFKRASHFSCLLAC